MNWRDLKPGDRIRLLEMPDDPAPIEVGSEGTVTFVTDLSHLSDKIMFQIGVDWDSGRALNLVERDKWEKISA
jgi:hypothetical protein